MKEVNKKKAFTLVEVLVVLAILGILTVAVIMGVNWSTDRARESGVQATLHSYEIAANKVGVELAGYDNVPLDELVKLLNKSLDGNLKLAISNDVIVSDAVDPWGNTIKVGYNKPTKTNGQLKFTSSGPNGIVGDTDDISITVTHLNVENGNGNVVVEHVTPVEGHTHEYSAQVQSPQYLVTPGTCTTPAKYYVSCSCGDVGYGTFNGDVDSTNHTNVSTTYIELNDTHHTKKEVCSACNVEFTSQEELHVGELECTLCGAVIHTHTYDQQVATPTYQYLPASCISKAKYYYSCSCGAKGSETFEHGELAAHSYTLTNTAATGAKVSDATCASKAVYYKSCVGCGALGTETFESGDVDLTNHVGNSRTEYTNLSATQHLKKITCDACNTIKSSTNENHTMNAQNTCTLCNAHTHNFNQQVVSSNYLKSAATCTSKAVYYKSCTCGEKGTTTFESGTTTAHNMTNTVNSTYLKSAANCILKAVYYRSCSYCGTKDTVTFENGNVDTMNHVGNASTTYESLNATQHTKKVTCDSCHTTKSTTTENHTFNAQNTCTLCNNHVHNFSRQNTSADYLYRAADCTNKAIYYYSCVCGLKGTETFNYGSTTAHNYAAETATDTYLKSVATCTAKAVYYKSCTGCGAKGTTTFEVGTFNASNHSKTTKVKATTAAVCWKWECCGAAYDTTHVMVNTGTAGVHQTCSDCGYYTTVHTYNVDSGVQYTAATCTAARKNYQRCSCGYNPRSVSYVVSTGSVNSSNHTGTSTYGGTSSVHTKYTCCGATISSSHTYDQNSGVKYSDATCTTKQKNYKSCICGYNPKNASYLVEVGSVNASNHTGTSTYGGTSGVHTKYTCCGATISTTHTYDQNSGVKYSDATCTAKQKNYKSCACGYNPKNASYLVDVGSINSSNHTGSSTYGGTASVHTKYSCCGATISTTHTYNVDSGVQYSAATCLAARKNYQKCACGYNPQSASYVVSTGSVNSSNHTGSSTYGGTSSVHTKYTCCGATISSSHTYDQNSGVKYSDATCTAKQKNYKSCICGYNPKSTSYLVDVGSVNSSNHTGSSTYGGTSGVHTKYSCCGATISSSHTYNVDSGVQYTAATCTAARKNYLKCACGYNPQSASYVVSTGSVNSSNHTGTSTYGGTSSVHTKYTCCGATISGSHTYDTDSGVKYSDATCIAKQTNYKRCACGYNPKSASYVVETGSVNSNNHVGGTYYSYTNLNATQHTKYTKCNSCNVSLSSTAENHTLNAQNTCTLCNNHTHSYTQKVVSSTYLNSNATCTSKATYFYSCVCGQKGTSTFENGNALGHSWTNACDTTCNRDSSHTRTITHTYSYTCDTTCNVCGATRSASHNYQQTKAPTCTATGTKTCSYGCGSTQTIAKHSCTWSYTCDTTCNCCGCTRSASHNYQQTKAATCTATGTKTCSYGCGSTQTIAALGHTGGTANCTTKAVCTRCNTSYGSVDSTKHNYGSATCTSAATCTRCGATSGSAIGHLWAYTCSTTCGRSGCGATRSASHNYTQTKAATCTATGTKTCSYGCGSTQTIAKHSCTWSYTCDTTCNCCGCTRSASHNSVNAATASVCKKCSYCGTSLDTTHTYSYTCDTTCNDCGYTRSASHNYTYTCSTTCSYGCGTTRSASHNYQQTKAATCTATGTKTCSYGCGSTQTIAKHSCTWSYTCDTTCNCCGCTRSASHNSVNAATASVCKKCSYCGTSLDTSHAYSYTCDTTCNDCGYVRSASHNYTYTCSTSCSYGCGTTREAHHTGELEEDSVVWNNDYQDTACDSAVGEAICDYCNNWFEETTTNIIRNADIAATCTNSGWFDCVAVFTYIRGDSGCCPECHYDKSPLGHNVSSPSKSWTKYTTYCKLTLTGTCTRCNASLTLTPSVTTYNAHTDATCTADERWDCLSVAPSNWGGQTYRCNGWHYGDDALGHDYASPTISWATGHTSFTLSTTCSRCTSNPSQTVSTTKRVVTNASCTTQGKYDYYGTITNQTLVDVCTEYDVPVTRYCPDYHYTNKLPHYGQSDTDTWDTGWNSSHTSCTIGGTCDTCGTYFTETSTNIVYKIWWREDCTSDSYADHRAIFTQFSYVDGSGDYNAVPCPTAHEGEDGTAYGHSYKTPTYTWADDHSSLWGATQCQNVSPDGEACGRVQGQRAYSTEYVASAGSCTTQKKYDHRVYASDWTNQYVKYNGTKYCMSGYHYAGGTGHTWNSSTGKCSNCGTSCSHSSQGDYPLCTSYDSTYHYYDKWCETCGMITATKYRKEKHNWVGDSPSESYCTGCDYYSRFG